MKLKIGNTAVDKSYFNSYVVECEAMFGDADGEGFVNIGGFVKDKDEIYLEDLLNLCKRLKKERRINEGYNHVEGFNKWFDIDYLTDDEYDALPETIKELSIYWLNDPQVDGRPANFRNYKVFYYDKTGVKYHVNVTL